jgi:hypothetical protein
LSARRHARGLTPEQRFGLKPERLAADTAYGAAPMPNWLVEEKGSHLIFRWTTNQNEGMAPSRAMVHQAGNNDTGHASGW